MNYKLSKEIGDKVAAKYNQLPITSDFSTLELLPLSNGEKTNVAKSGEDYGFMRFRDGNKETVTCIEFSILKAASKKSKDSPFSIKDGKTIFTDDMLYLGINGSEGVEVEWKAA